MFRGSMIGLLLILSGLAHAEPPSCNDLLSGISSEMQAAIHQLAELRYDLDQRSVRGQSDALFRALQISFRQKWIETLKASDLHEDALSLIVRTEIQKIQNQDEIDVALHRKTKKEAFAEGVAAEHRIERIGDLSSTRYGHTQSVLPNDRILVVGGFAPWGASAIEMMDLNAKHIEPFKDLSDEKIRIRHAQVSLQGGRVLLAGGSDIGWKNISSIQVIDSNTRQIEVIANLIKTRDFLTVSLLPDGRVLVVGGAGEDSSVALIEIIDPVLKTVEEIGELSEARYHHASTVLQDGRVLVAGGYDKGVGLSSIEVIDPIHRKIRKIGELSGPRYEHTQTLLPDGRVLVVGGSSLDNEYFSLIEIIDPVTGKVEKWGELQEGRVDHSATLISDHRVLVTGGRGPSGALSSIEIIDLNTGKSEVIGELYEPRSQHAQSLLVNDRVVVTGGKGKEGDRLSSVEVIQVGRK